MINLHRTVTVTSFDVEATVAVGRERPELLAVARLAKDLDRPIDGADVSTQLLGRLPEQVGWRVVERCVDLGILERSGWGGPASLSRVGDFALEFGTILIPEEGTWRFYLLVDPLVSSQLVHCERLDPPRANEDRNELRSAPRDSRGRQRPPKSDRVPPPITAALSDSTIARSIANSTSFQLLSLPRNTGGASGPEATLRLELAWPENSAPTLKLRGQWPLPEPPSHARQRKQRESTLINTMLPLPENVASVPYEEVWFVLAAFGGKADLAITREWFKRTGRRLLPSAFDALDDGARTTHRRDLPLPAFDLGPEFGKFESTTLAGVDLVPHTKDDAQRWAEWLQLRLLNDYATPTTLATMNEEILAKFPDYLPRLPSAQALLDAACERPLDPKSRFLLAPADLGLWS